MMICLAGRIGMGEQMTRANVYLTKEARELAKTRGLNLSALLEAQVRIKGGEGYSLSEGKALIYTKIGEISNILEVDKLDRNMLGEIELKLALIRRLITALEGEAFFNLTR